MTVYLASDHAGFAYKEELRSYIGSLGYAVVDLGPYVLDPADDYPDYIAPCAQKVANEEGSLGIVLGWSGQGEAMVANRTKGVRAAVFYGPHAEKGYELVTLAREHNNANILSLGAHFLTLEEAKEAVRIFLGTPFSGDERHVRRLAKF